MTTVWYDVTITMTTVGYGDGLHNSYYDNNYDNYGSYYYDGSGLPSQQGYRIDDATITMTTVGYGDKVPLGPIGRLVGAACAICGVLTLAIPVPIITGHFNRFYAHKTGRGRNI